MVKIIFKGKLKSKEPTKTDVMKRIREIQRQPKKPSKKYI